AHRRIRSLVWPGPGSGWPCTGAAVGEPTRMAATRPDQAVDRTATRSLRDLELDQPRHRHPGLSGARTARAAPARRRRLARRTRGARGWRRLLRVARVPQRRPAAADRLEGIGAARGPARA